MTDGVLTLLHVQQDGLQLVYHTQNGGNMEELMAVANDVKVAWFPTFRKVWGVQKRSNNSKSELASMQHLWGQLALLLWAEEQANSDGKAVEPVRYGKGEESKTLSHSAGAHEAGHAWGGGAQECTHCCPVYIQVVEPGLHQHFREAVGVVWDCHTKCEQAECRVIQKEANMTRLLGHNVKGVGNSAGKREDAAGEEVAK